MRKKREEQRIASVLDNAGIAYRREHHVDFTCVVGGNRRQFARIDFLITFENKIVMLEVDEGQHRFGDYSVGCDMRRMARIVESLAVEGNTIPILFVRYNPHSFKVDGHTKTVKRDKREEALLQKINASTDTDTDGTPLNILYMYYNAITNENDELKPCVMDDPEFNPHMAGCCMPPVV
jgi:hypothetical protein